MVIYWDDLFDRHVEHHVNYHTPKEALEEAAFRISYCFIHRVEVWDGDRRMLLEVS